MPYRLLALVAASVMTLTGSALAQKKEPTTDSLNLNSSRSNTYRNGQTMQPGGTKADKAINLNSSRSNTYRGSPGGGGPTGGGGQARMGGGGGTSTK
jgi:hypothetical protein